MKLRVCGATRMSETLLPLANVESAYGPVRAMRGVSLHVDSGHDRHCTWGRTAPGRRPS